MLEEMFIMNSTKNTLSPIERIISGKYGKTGLAVYSLIDGKRTAREIMKATKIGEAKFSSMVDFMHYQGIVKVDYPKNSAQA